MAASSEPGKLLNVMLSSNYTAVPGPQPKTELQNAEEESGGHPAPDPVSSQVDVEMGQFRSQNCGTKEIPQ